jgi:hypothetical protein
LHTEQRVDPGWILALQTGHVDTGNTWGIRSEDDDTPHSIRSALLDVSATRRCIQPEKPLPDALAPVNDSFTPRTVVVVALASLLAGFVTVFGGGMLFLRGHEIPTSPVEGTPQATTPAVVSNETMPVADTEAGAPGSDEAPAITAAGVTLSPLSISRCFVGTAPVPVPGERCGTLTALDQHFASRAAAIAACANGGHGRLAFVMDLRFSNQHVGAWGGPASTVPNAGPVSLCVRRASAPLPLATMQHGFDRYIVTIPIEWQ